MTTFDELETEVQVYNLLDEDGNILEQNVPADYPVEEGQTLVASTTVPQFHMMQYLDVFQALIDKIKSL